jgi:anti-anti-sigma factor
LSDEHSVLEVIEVREAGRVRVRLRGELDLAGAPRLGQTLRGLRERRESVLLDFDELAFIDMSGLRIVLAAAEEANPRRVGVRSNARLAPGAPAHRAGAARRTIASGRRLAMTTVSRQLPRSPVSASTARGLVDAHSTMLDFQQREDAALMVSELVNNALLHGIGTISLRIDVETNGVRVEVADQGNVALAPSPTPGAHGGWGLRIVDELADDWGVSERSTRVWFRLIHPGQQH